MLKPRFKVINFRSMLILCVALGMAVFLAVLAAAYRVIGFSLCARVFLRIDGDVCVFSAAPGGGAADAGYIGGVVGRRFYRIVSDAGRLARRFGV